MNTALKQPVEGVIFDYGGVLTTPVGDSIRAWLDREGVDPSTFSRAIKEWLSRDAAPGTPIHQLELGDLGIDEFNGLLAAKLALVDGGTVAPDGLLDRLFADVRVSVAMFDLVEELRDLGVRLALLSNSWGDDYPWDELDRLFDTVVISGRVGMRKPDPEMFAHVLGLLDLDPAQVVLVDDADPNIAGATRAGLRAVHHLSVESTRDELSRLIPGLHPKATKETP